MNRTLPEESLNKYNNIFRTSSKDNLNINEAIIPAKL